MIRFALGVFDRFLRLALAALLVVTAASCGSGAVSGPPAVVTPGPLSISPASATLYSDLPTDFVIRGGNGSYIVTSSNQQVVAISGAFAAGSVLTVVPSQVAADTNVTLTVGDTAGTTPVTATLVVKPRTVTNVVRVTPSASQSAACGAAVCSGGDAEVSVMLTQAGIPLRNRSVRFDVVSGDIRIITSPPGVGESLSLSGTTTTDDTGTARMRIRVLPDAAAQTALLQITDTSSGFTQRTAVTIAPSSNAPLNAQPSSISFSGKDVTSCASNVSADIIVFGGRPPYSVSQPGSFTVSPTTLARSGDRFTVTANGQCVSDATIAIVDSNGASVSVIVKNSISPATPTTPPPFVVSPTAVTLDSCTAQANVVVTGGLGGPYFAASGNSAVAVRVSANTGIIQRQSASGPVLPVPPSTNAVVTVSFSDGRSATAVTVNLVGPGAGVCP